MSRPELHPKDVVLAAAQHLLIEHGYAGLSMRELAQRCGLAKATLYHHFPDKRAIFLGVLERNLDDACQRIQRAAAVEGSVPIRLRSLIEAYFQLQQEQRMIMLMVLRDAASQDPQVCALVRRYHDAMLQPIAALLAHAIAAGAMRPVNVEMTVISLLGMLQSFVTHRLLLDDRAIDAEVVDHTLDLLLRGLLPHAANVGSDETTQPA